MNRVIKKAQSCAYDMDEPGRQYTKWDGSLAKGLTS